MKSINNSCKVRFEKPKDLIRETQAIELFVSMFNGSYEKLGANDHVDFKVFDSNGKLISYVEVKGRNREIKNAFPLPVAARKLVNLSDCRKNPVMIWACYDGIIYGKTNDIIGKVQFSGRKPRKGSAHDLEQMVYYSEQGNNFKIIKFSKK